MRLANVRHLGIKELRSLVRDPVLMILIVYAFSVAIYAAATAMPETLNNAAIAIVDEDRSPLSTRIVAAFYPPYFNPPKLITQSQMDARMDAGLDTFALDIPPDFQRDVLAGRRPEIQLNVDATRMTQAFAGSRYVQAIVSEEVEAFVKRYRATREPPVELALRVRFNPQLNKSWFGAIMEVIGNVTMLSIILTGAALIREREHGTVEHLLVMPVTPAEIMTSKSGRWGWWCCSPAPSRCSAWSRGCWRCRSRARSRCSWPAPRSTSSPPPRSASSWAPSPARCRSSGCC